MHPEVGRLTKGCLIRIEDMNIRVRIAVMSHLSDAQATDDWATENELNEIANKLKKQ